MGEVYKVGKDCDAWCTRCKMDLGHTIVAMVEGLPVQVKCDTCHSFHKYRAPKSAPKPVKAARVRAERPPGAPARPSTAAHGSGVAEAARSGRENRREATQLHGRWQTLVGRRDVSDSRRYNVREVFSPDELIDHPKFGLGVVVDGTLPGRMRVLFADGERVLVCGTAPISPPVQ